MQFFHTSLPGFPEQTRIKNVIVALFLSCHCECVAVYRAETRPAPVAHCLFLAHFLFQGEEFFSLSAITCYLVLVIFVNGHLMVPINVSIILTVSVHYSN